MVNNQPYWSQYDNLIFNLSAPIGHLPIRYDVETPSGVIGVVEGLLSRPDLVFHSEINENYKIENIKTFLDKIVPKNPEIFEEVINEKIIFLLADKTVISPIIPDDNNEASIISVDEPYDIELKPEWTNNNNDTLFIINFTLSVECQLSYYIYKADYYILDDDKSNQISIDEWNDHYFSAEEIYQLNVEGIISVKGDPTPLELSLLLDNELLEFLQETDISIDSITSIEVAF